MVSIRRRELLLVTGVTVVLAGAAMAQPSAPRWLELKNTHTGETFAGAYRDAEGPIPEAMTDLAVLLRDTGWMGITVGGPTVGAVPLLPSCRPARHTRVAHRRQRTPYIRLGLIHQRPLRPSERQIVVQE
jgi:hypothetical protein